jgi:hypothetical protein
MKKVALLALLYAAHAFAQSITIPAQTITTPVTVNATTVKLTITVPQQVVPLPASVLPAGLTWSNGVLAVAGSVSATSVALTGGPALPTCASELFLWQLVSGTLQPACYTPPAFTVPPVTVSQSDSPVNTFTVTP